MSFVAWRKFVIVDGVLVGPGRLINGEGLAYHHATLLELAGIPWSELFERTVTCGHLFGDGSEVTVSVDAWDRDPEGPRLEALALLAPWAAANSIELE